MTVDPPIVRRSSRLRAGFLGLCALALVATPARAGEVVLRADGSGPRDVYSAGFMLGAPTGLLLQKNLPGGRAWDVGLAFLYGPGLRLHGDYKWTLATLETNSDLLLRFQVGAGALVGSLTSPCAFYGSFGCDDGFYAGARLPIDVEMWTQAPISFGLEVAPVLAVSSYGLGGFVDAFFFLRFVL